MVAQVDPAGAAENGEVGGEGERENVEKADAN